MVSLYNINYCAFLAYAPKGTCNRSKNSRKVKDAVKNCRPPLFQQIFEKISESIEENNIYHEFFDEGTTLVPMPRSYPFVTGGLWPGIEICKRLVNIFPNRGISELITRHTRVKQSSTAEPGSRPTAEDHFNSMSIERVLFRHEKIILIDDFITKGSTILGAAACIKSVYPECEVKAFALVRTKGRVPTLDKIIDPFIGEISAISGRLDW